MISASLLLIAGLIVLGVISLINLRKNFTERLFLKIGLWLFLIMGSANSYGFYFIWEISPIEVKISKLAGILFNFLIAYFFYYLMKKSPASMGGEGTSLSTEQLNKFLEEDVEKELNKNGS